MNVSDIEAPREGSAGAYDAMDVKDVARRSDGGIGGLCPVTPMSAKRSEADAATDHEVELPFRVLIPRGDPEVVPESAMPSERP